MGESLGQLGAAPHLGARRRPMLDLKAPGALELSEHLVLRGHLRPGRRAFGDPTEPESGARDVRVDPPQTPFYFDGEEAVLIGVSMADGENVLDVLVRPRALGDGLRVVAFSSAQDVGPCRARAAKSSLMSVISNCSNPTALS